MYAWEKSFAKLIAHIRKKQLNIVRKNSYVRGLYMTFMLFTTRMAVFCTMLSIILLYGRENLAAAKVFVISAYFNTVSISMSEMFVRCVAEIAEAWVSFRRLQNFLEYEEKDFKAIGYIRMNSIDQNGNNYHQNDICDMGNNAVVLKYATASWFPRDKKKDETTNEKDKKSQNPALNRVNVNFWKRTLIGVVGRVGSLEIVFFK